ncbi:MAG: hypothetical protein FJX53_11750 [Alphaproteobacteria bacterium]|nr:hypothetical protein [Alphaproteobacteria bacterium]
MNDRGAFRNEIGDGRIANVRLLRDLVVGRDGVDTDGLDAPRAALFPQGATNEAFGSREKDQWTLLR